MAISDLPVVPCVLLDGAIPRTPFERIQHIVASMEEGVPIDLGLVTEATRLSKQGGDANFIIGEIEDELVEELNEWLVPHKRQMIVWGRDPDDLLILAVNDDDDPVDGEGRLYAE